MSRVTGLSGDYSSLLEREEWFWANDRFARSPDFRAFSENPQADISFQDRTCELTMRGKYYNYIFETVSSKTGASCLELGCGSAWLSIELARRGVAVTGIDLCQPLIEQASNFVRNLREKEPGTAPTEFRRADLNAVELPADAFDYVVAWDALHHVTEIRRLMEQVWASLKEGGRIIVCDHVRPTPRINRALAIVGYLLMPTDLRYSRKLLVGLRCLRYLVDRDTETLRAYLRRYPEPIRRYVLRLFGISLSKEDSAWTDPSPCEDVSASEIVEAIRCRFHVERKEEILGFVYPHLVARVRSPWRSWRRAMIRFLRLLDGLTLRLRLCTAEFVFVVGVKRSVSPE